MLFKKISLKYYLIYFIILQFILTTLSYFLFGKLKIEGQYGLEISQTFLLIFIVSISNFCFTIIGFTILSIFLESLLIIVNDYDRGYKLILKAFLLTGVFQIPISMLKYLFKIEVGAFSFNNLVIDVIFKIVEISFFGKLMYSSISKKDARILVIAFICVEIISYVGLQLIIHFFVSR